MSGIFEKFQDLFQFQPKVLFGCILAILTYVLYKFAHGPKKLPPGPYGLPLLGYLPFLGKEPHKTFKRLSDKYGRIFSMYLGRRLVVVFGEYPTMKEALMHPAFLGRPPEAAFAILPEKLGMATVNGTEWQEQRRHAITTLKNLMSKIQRLEDTIQDDLLSVVKYLKEQDGSPVMLRQQLTASTVNNIWFLLFGERISWNTSVSKFLSTATNTMAEYFGATNPIGFYPWLAKVYSTLRIGGYHEAVSQMKDINVLVKKEVDNRLKRRNSEKPDHFILDYFEKMEKDLAKNGHSKDSYFSIPTLRGTLQGFFFGGSETTRTSLEWSLYTVASFPDIQKKIHAEIDDVIGTERRVFWKDHNDMPYTQAFLAEIQRWKTLVPVNGLRYSLEDVIFEGYNIPKGSIIMMNFWAAHFNPKDWPNPEEFRPERFLSEDGKTFTKPEPFLPFSLGRRKCPGEEMANIVIFIFFTTIMQNFNVTPPRNTKPNLDDFVFGLTYQPVENELCFFPR